MEVVDAQIHLAPDAEATQLVEAMDTVGVAAALIVNQSKHGPDNSRQLDASRQYPGRFAVVGGVDLTRPDVDLEIEKLKQQPGLVGIRVVVNNRDLMSRAGLPAATLERLTRDIELWESPDGYRPLFVALQKYRLPLCIYMPGRLGEIGTVCRTYSDLQFVIDHLNLIQNPRAIVSGVSAFTDLPLLLELAEYPNVALKATAMPTVSQDRFPFADLWPYLHRIISAFGLERVMWGSDWTQVSDRCTYAEGVNFVRDTTELSASDKAQLMGQTLRRIFGWRNKDRG